MFFIGQNLKHVHMTCSFLELLIFFGLTLDISCLKFISHPTKEILYVNTNFMGNQSLSKTKHFHLFLILMLKNVFFNVKLKFLINYNFLSFINTFSEEAVRTCSSKYAFLKISQYLELKRDSSTESFSVRSSH